MTPADGRLTVLLTNVRLDGRTGTETWLEDYARELQRQGHRPVVYTPRPGPIADSLRVATVPVVTDPRQLAQAPDVIHGHHTNPALTALLAFPGIPAVLFVHDWAAWHDRPLRFPRIRRIVPVDETCADRALEAGFTDDEVDVVLNFVDTARFTPRAPLPQRPRRALLLDNDARPDEGHGAAVLAACREAGIDLDIVGQATGRLAERPEELIPRYDIVFAKAKAAMEAIATGCAVILVHHQGIGGLVTSSGYAAMRRRNFGRRTLQEPVSAACLLEHIAGYDPADAVAVSRLLREDASLEVAAVHLVALYRDVIAEQAAASVDLAAELEALQAYLRAIETNFEVIEFASLLEQQRARIEDERAELEAELVQVRATQARVAEDDAAVRSRLEAKLHVATARVAVAEAEAHRVVIAFEGLRMSRRWQATQKVMRPFDALRRR